MIVTIIIQVLFQNAQAFDDDGFSDWPSTLSPYQLCLAYKDGLIDDDELPGGRAETPCENWDGDY